MKALISPIQDNFVVQVEEDKNTFEIALPLYWIDCPDNITAYNYQYIENEFVPYIVEVSAEENKQTAMSLLQATDWTIIPDVGDPTKSNPYLANVNDFVAYRNSIRQYAINPVAGKIDWEVIPTENWQSV